MKVRQFLNKFLCASSTIDHVFVIVRGFEKTRLCGIVSFCITGGDLTIYAE